MLQEWKQRSDMSVTSAASSMDSQMGGWAGSGSTMCGGPAPTIKCKSHPPFSLSFLIRSLNSFIHMKMGGHGHSTVSDHSLWTLRPIWKHGGKVTLTYEWKEPEFKVGRYFRKVIKTFPMKLLCFFNHNPDKPTVCFFPLKLIPSK